MASDDFDLTPMQEGAIAMREIFESYVEAGFTEDHALELVKAHIVAASPTNPGGTDG